MYLASVFFVFSALYQLHLVKAETARAFIPTELRLVEAFGYYIIIFYVIELKLLLNIYIWRRPRFKFNKLTLS